MVKGTLLSLLFSRVKGESRREKDKTGSWAVNREKRERKGMKGENVRKETKRKKMPGRIEISEA